MSEAPSARNPEGNGRVRVAEATQDTAAPVEHETTLQNLMVGASVSTAKWTRAAAIAAVVSAFASMLTAGAVVLIYRQTEIAEAAAGVQHWQAISTEQNINSRIFVEYPEVRPYFFKKVPISPSDQLFDRVMAVADMQLDFMDGLEEPYVYRLPGMNVGGEMRVLWDKWFADMFANSPALCIRYEELKDVYVKAIGRFTQPGCASHNSVGANALGKERIPPETSTRHQSAPIGDTTSTNLGVSSKVELKTDRTGASGEKEHYNLAEWLVALFTAALVVVTGYLVFYTKNLWAATGALVRGAEDTAKRQLRAYLNVLGSSITLQNHNTFIRIYMAVNNSGQTPAYKVSTWKTFQVRDLPQLVPTFQMAPPPEERESSSIVGSGTKIDLLIDHPISPEQLDGLNNGTKAIYVWGRIDYEDAFGEPHWLTFRSISGKINGQSGWTLQPDHDGNDAG